MNPARELKKIALELKQAEEVPVQEIMDFIRSQGFETEIDSGRIYIYSGPSETDERKSVSEEEANAVAKKVLSEYTDYIEEGRMQKSYPVWDEAKENPVYYFKMKGLY